ncbi:hypothetical protein GCM10009758_17050 [Microbacterium hatanonis]
MLRAQQAALGTQALFNTLAHMGAVSSLGTGTIVYDGSRDPDGDLNEDLRAVALATTLGMKSLDKARKQFASLPGAVEHPPRAAYIQAYKRAMSHVESCRRSLQTNEHAPLTEGMFAGSVAMERLIHTMFSAHVLYQLRLRIEADAVARVALEQIAWSVAVAPLDDFESVAKVQPQRSMSAMKSLVTQPSAGRLYSYLSSSAHAGIGQHLAVFDVDDDGRGLIRHGVTDWAGSAQVVMSIADLWVVAYESVQHDHLSRLTSVTGGPPFTADPKRPFLTEMIDTINEIRRLEEADPEDHGGGTNPSPR